MTSDVALSVARRVECEADGLYFARYFFKQRFNSKMIVAPHHVVMQAALDRTMLPPDHPDFISRLIINVPPGYTKTELASINYMARGLAVNAAARFLHLSYSHKLALTNSATVRSIVKSSEYQNLWAVSTKDDVDSKEIWHTTKGGGVTATAAGGQVTGFRAGHLDATRFTGALIIDDPVKPDDAHSDTLRKAVNDNYNETIASRLAVETVPVILIMQRVHDDDLAGYLLKGGSGEMWHHLELPVKIGEEGPYPEEYTHAIRIPHGLPDGWLWPYKHNEAHETALRAHRRRWAAQYLQRPLKRDAYRMLWDDDMIAAARALTFAGVPTRTVVAVDPATSNSDTSDEHGIIAASLYGPNEYQIRADATLERGRPEDWAGRAIATYDRYDADAIVIETNQGGDMCESTLRNAGFKGKVIRVHAYKGKTLRAEPASALYGLRYVSHAPGCGKLEDEQLDFDPITGKSQGRSPNRLDAAVYALTELSGGDAGLEELLKMAMGES